MAKNYFQTVFFTILPIISKILCEEATFHKPCGDGVTIATGDETVLEVRSEGECMVRCLAMDCVATVYTESQDGGASCRILSDLVNCEDTVNQTGARLWQMNSPACENNGTWTGTECLCEPPFVGTLCQRYPIDCFEIYNAHPDIERNEPWLIQPIGYSSPALVGCRHGQTEILRRFGTRCSGVNFNRTFLEYKAGFADDGFECDFWVGLDLIHAITTQATYKLQVSAGMDDGTNITTYKGQYDNAVVDDENNGYTLHLQEYLSIRDIPEIGDSLLFLSQTNLIANGQPFSTYDHDVDSNPDMNCASAFGGGWWYNACTAGVLTAPYPENDARFRDPNVPSMFWTNNLGELTVKSTRVRLVRQN